MKKMIFFLTCVISFGFNIGSNYTCETIGLDLKTPQGVVSIPNNFETNEKIKESLKELYSVKIKVLNNSLEINVGGEKDVLNFVKNLQKDVKLYKTSDSQTFIITDDNSTQIVISIPAAGKDIYYQCK